MADKRVLICTFVALTSGLFGSYFGGQISWLARTNQCRDRPEVLDDLCRARQIPGAFWKGSTAGAWTGTILGAFIAGLATKESKKNEEKQTNSQANSQALEKKNPLSKVKQYPPLEGLTADEIATLRIILRSHLESEKNPPSNQKIQNTNQETLAPSSTTLSFAQFIDWADAVGKQSKLPPIITYNKAREILIYLCFSETKIDAVWQELNRGADDKKCQ